MHKRTLRRQFPLYIPYTAMALGGFLILSAAFFIIPYVLPVQWIVSVPLDAYIPFCDWFVIPYVLWYVYFLGTALFFLHVATRGSAGKYECAQFLLFVFGGYTVATLLFVIIPNGVPFRPAVEEMDTSRPLTALAALLFTADKDARNVFPSLHCLVQFDCTAALLRSKCVSKKVKRWLAPVLIAFSLLVFAATLFLRQHSVLDLVGALVLGGVTYPLAYKIRWRFLPKEECENAR